MSNHDQHEEARLALQSGVAAVEKIIRDRDIESHIAQLRLGRLLGLLAKVRSVQEFCASALAESEAVAGEGESGWDVEVDARTILGLLEVVAPPFSDAVIVDMLSAFYGEERDGWSVGKVRRMRAALRAAGRVR